MAFRFRSGRLCLNFCATVGERWRGRYERLPSPADLARWYVEAQLIPKALPLDTGDLERARVVREAIYRRATALTTAERPRRTDQAIINSAAQPAPLVPQLVNTKLRWSMPSEAAGPVRRRDCPNPIAGLRGGDMPRPGP